MSFISCLMVTRGGLWPARQAIATFQRQSHAARELVVVSPMADDPIAAFVRETGDPTIRHVASGPGTLGERRNIAVAHSRGDIVATWDDDDLHHHDRLARQWDAMQHDGHAACFISRLLLWWPARQRLMVTHRRPWEGSMVAHRAVVPIMPALDREEDMRAVSAMLALRPATMLDWPAGYAYVVHGGNTNTADHFDTMCGFSQSVEHRDGYQGALAALQGEHDFAGYADALAASPRP